MKFCLVVANSSFLFFKELIEALQSHLVSFGHSVEVLNYIPEVPFSVVWVIGPHNFSKFERKPKTKYIALQTEQLPQKGFISQNFQSQNYNHLKNLLPLYDYIFDVHEGNTFFLQKQGFNKVSFFPIGYDSHFDFYKNSSPTKKIYDIAFFGYLSPRREALLTKLGFKYNVCPATSAFGEERNNLILQTKICLSFHVEALDFFERMRIELLYLSNNCFVISENTTYHTPYISSKHLIFSPYQSIEATIGYYLKNPFQCQKIANNAYNFIKENYVFQRNLQKSLQAIGI